MLHVALRMLMGDRTKYAGLLLGIGFTAFLVTFAMSYFSGFMTRGFALVTENASADIWVMDPAVRSPELTINMPDSALARVRSIDGVRYAVPLALGDVDARFPNGRFQSFHVIGVDDATLTGVPQPEDDTPVTALRAPDAVIVDPGGTSGKLGTPVHAQDRWPHGGAHLDVPLRPLRAGDELLVNDRLVRVAGRSRTVPRFPPRPLMYTTYSNALRVLPAETNHVSFVLVSARHGVASTELARRITRRTGLRARTAAQFKEDTVRWYLVNSEDVGDMTAMLMLAITVGFGVTGVMLYMFSYENQHQYAVLKAMGTPRRSLMHMVFVQSGLCAVLGTGLGIGTCALVGVVVGIVDFPFRMMWFAPVFGVIGVLLISLTAAAISVRPVLKLAPGQVFAGR